MREACNDLNIELLFQPAYTPEFNCCEPMWAVVKQNFKYKLAEHKMTVLKQHDFEALLW